MPKIYLQLKANVENVSAFYPVGVDFRWYLKLKCCNCGEQPDHWQYVALDERSTAEGSRGSAHLVEKCKLCGRQNQLEIVEESIAKYKVQSSESNEEDEEDQGSKSSGNQEWQTVVAFECRGLEPTEFDARRGWEVETDAGTVFSDVNLSEKDWSEYDEKASASVGIYDLEHRFTKTADKKVSFAKH